MPATMLAKQATTVGGAMLLAVFLSFIGGVASSRLLGPSDRGLLAAIMLWPVIGSLIGDLGIGVPLVRKATSDEGKTQHLATIALMATCLSLLYAPIGIVVATYLLPTSSIATQVLGFASFALYVPMHIGARLFAAISQGKGNARHFAFTRIAPTLIFTLGMLILLLLDRRSIAAAVTLFLLAGTGGLTVSMAPYVKDFQIPNKDDFHQLLDFVREGLPVYVGNLTPIDSLKIDIAVVSLVLSTTQVGFYTAAVAVAYLYRLPGTVLGTIAVPIAARTRSFESGINVTRWTVTGSTIISVFIALLSFPMMPVLVPLLFGKDFSEATPLVVILALGMVAAGCRQALGDCLRGLGMGGAGSWAEAASWFVAAAGFLVLIPSLGVNGAALATTLSYLASFAFTLALARRLYGLPLRHMIIPTVHDVKLLEREVAKISLSRRSGRPPTSASTREERLPD